MVASLPAASVAAVPSRTRASCKPRLNRPKTDAADSPHEYSNWSFTAFFSPDMLHVVCQPCRILHVRHAACHKAPLLKGGPAEVDSLRRLDHGLVCRIAATTATLLRQATWGITQVHEGRGTRKYEKQSTVAHKNGVFFNPTHANHRQSSRINKRPVQSNRTTARVPTPFHKPPRIQRCSQLGYTDRRQ